MSKDTAYLLAHSVDRQLAPGVPVVTIAGRLKVRRADLDRFASGVVS